MGTIKISIQNNSVSMPVFEADFSDDLDRHDTGIRVDVTWENGDAESVHLPRELMAELVKTINWAKKSHPAFMKRTKT